MINLFNINTSLKSIASRYKEYIILNYHQLSIQVVMNDIIKYINENTTLLTKYEHLLLGFCTNIINYNGKNISSDTRLHISYSILRAIADSLNQRKNNSYIHSITRKMEYVLRSKNPEISRIDMLLYNKLKKESISVNEYSVGEFCNSLISLNDKCYMVAHNFIMFL